ncbi:MAG: carboxypeptidase-like regulatory domain-containing protein [Planctomycetota bacterium]
MARPLFALFLLLALAAVVLFLLQDGDSGDVAPSAPVAAARPGPSSGPGPAQPREGGDSSVREAVEKLEWPEPAAVPAPADGSLTVKLVRRPDGSPVFAADCEVTDGYLGSVSGSGATDAQGLFSLPLRSLPADPFLVVRKEGYLQVVRRVDAAQPAVWIQLEPGVPLRGMVLDGTTLEPLPGAGIEAFLEADFSELAYGIRTDREGRFLIPGVPLSSPVNLAASLEGYRSTTQSGSFDAPVADLRLLLFRGAAVEGTVQDEDGRPVQDARVRLAAVSREGEEREDGGFEEQATTTDAAGCYRLETLGTPNWYVLQAASDLSGSARLGPFELLRDREVLRKDLRLVAGKTSLAVMALAEGGRPVAHLELQLTDPEGLPPRAEGSGEIEWERGFAYLNGVHLYAPLRPGRYRLVARAEGRPAQSVWVDVESGRRNEVTVVLPPGTLLVGVVRNESGEPLAGVPVEFIYALDVIGEGGLLLAVERILDGEEEGLIPVLAATGKEGRFQMEGLPDRAGTVVVGERLVGEGSLSAPYATVVIENVVPGGAPLEVILKEAPRVIGRFEPPGQGVPASCLIQHENLMHGGELAVDAQGRFELHYPRPDALFDLVLDPGTGAPFLFTGLKLAAGETRDLGLLRILPGGSMEGVVADSARRPLAWVTVEVSCHGGLWWREAVTDEEGRYRLEGLPRLAGEVAFIPEEHASQIFVFDNLGIDRRQDVILLQPGVLEGIVLDGQGYAMAGALVEAESIDTGSDAAQWSDETITGMDGRFSFVLRPGQYRIFRSQGGGKRGGTPWEVRIEEDGLVEIELRY